jgi:predicted helicase
LGRDNGVDLAFTHKNGDVWAVQAKCHSPENTITETDIDTFINESDRRRFEWCENYSHSIVTWNYNSLKAMS